MGQARKTVQAATVLALAAEVVVAGILKQPHDGQHQGGHSHAPATLYATLVSTSAASLASSHAAFDCGPFRVHYAQAIETLTDEVSRYLPIAPVTSVVS
jgi:hypothetical protein